LRGRAGVHWTGSTPWGRDWPIDAGGAAAAAVSAALDHHVRTGAHLFGSLSAPAAEPLYAGLGFAIVDHAQMGHVEGP